MASRPGESVPEGPVRGRTNDGIPLCTGAGVDDWSVVPSDPFSSTRTWRLASKVRTRRPTWRDSEGEPSMSCRATRMVRWAADSVLCNSTSTLCTACQYVSTALTESVLMRMAAMERMRPSLKDTRKGWSPESVTLLHFPDAPRHREVFPISQLFVAIRPPRQGFRCGSPPTGVRPKRSLAVSRSVSMEVEFSFAFEVPEGPAVAGGLALREGADAMDRALHAG